MLQSLEEAVEDMRVRQRYRAKYLNSAMILCENRTGTVISTQPTLNSCHLYPNYIAMGILSNLSQWILIVNQYYTVYRMKQQVTWIKMKTRDVCNKQNILWWMQEPLKSVFYLMVYTVPTDGLYVLHQKHHSNTIKKLSSWNTVLPYFWSKKCQKSRIWTHTAC